MDPKRFKNGSVFSQRTGLASILEVKNRKWDSV